MIIGIWLIDWSCTSQDYFWVQLEVVWSWRSLGAVVCSRIAQLGSTVRASNSCEYIAAIAYVMVLLAKILWIYQFVLFEAVWMITGIYYTCMFDYVLPVCFWWENTWWFDWIDWLMELDLLLWLEYISRNYHGTSTSMVWYCMNFYYWFLCGYTKFIGADINSFNISSTYPYTKQCVYFWLLCSFHYYSGWTGFMSRPLFNLDWLIIYVGRGPEVFSR